MPGSRHTGTVFWHSQGMAQVSANSDWLDPALAARLARMPYTKRRGEARLGRWTAKVTIAALAGMQPQPARLRDVLVRNAADGAPEASIDGRPLDAVIAMTDRADWAVCAVMPGTARVGCDLELVEPRSDEFIRDYLTRAEQQWVDRCSDRALGANLIWSAKESALKVLRTGLRRDTRSVEVTPGEGGEGWTPLRVADVEGPEFHGWWRRFGDFLLTIVAETEIPPPRSVAEPEPLEHAVPTHTWMRQPYGPAGPQST